MFGLKKKKVAIFFLVSAFVSPFIFFSSAMKPWEDSDEYGIKIWQELIYPIEFTWHQVTSSLQNIWISYFDLSHAAQENKELKKELFLLKTKIIDYNHQIHEVKRLRNHLGFAAQYKSELMVAEVIGESGSSPFQRIRITKGHNNGIRAGMPVIADSGIVGRVLRTGTYYSDVQLLVDANFNLDVLVERTRIRGVLHGISESQCRLQLHRRADIRIGDTIITSGITGGFPKGLPVGQVIRIAYESDNVSQVITIKPWVDYHGLEEVVILKQIDKEVEKITESVGSKWFNYPPLKIKS